MLTWIIGWLAAPICGVFCPVAALPITAQTIAWLLPQTYLLEGMRALMTTGSMPWNWWLYFAMLTFVYASIFIIIFLASFAKSKKLGLLHLHSA